MRLIIDSETLEMARKDLHREIPKEVDTLERAGFMFFQKTEVDAFASTFFQSIKNEDYIERPRGYGAYYGTRPILEAINRVIERRELAFTIHIHPGFGEPIPSPADLKTEEELTESFIQVKQGRHGSIILSEDAILIRAWAPETNMFEKINNFSVENNT